MSNDCFSLEKSHCLKTFSNGSPHCAQLTFIYAIAALEELFNYH